jgi:hypothetical protein
MTDTVKIKTADLTGAALDWAVAKWDQEWSDDDALLWVQDDEYRYAPSTDWAQGGPVIERERISVGDQTHLEGQPEHSAWYATNRKGAHGFGTTPLIAVCRCYVASKLGNTVDVPAELIEAR